MVPRTPLPFSLAAVLLLAVCEALLPRPIYLQPSSFSKAHPKQCSPGTVFVSTEQWWTDELFTGSVAPLGHLHLETCWPMNQVLARRQKATIDTLQHHNPSATVEVTVRLMRPDLSPIDFVPPAQCGGSSAAPRDLLDCRRNILRSSLTPLVCNRTGGAVAMQYVLPAGSAEATSIDCRWRDQFILNTSQVAASGSVLYVVGARALAYSDPVPSGVVGLPAPRLTSVEAFLPGVLPDNASARCSGAWCGWNSGRSLTALAWTNGLQYTMCALYPVLQLPVGGIWRLAYTASPPNLVGTAVSRTIITLNANFHAGIAGTVVRNATGNLWQQQLPLNLTAQAKAGWNKITLQGKAVDPATSGVQTCSLSIYFELVPPCPPTAAPFMTHIWQDSINTLTTSSGLLQQTTGVTSMTLSAATAADQPFLLLSFDLSFLAARGVTIINATVFLRLTATGGAAMTQDVVSLSVFDGAVSWGSTCGTACPPLLPAATPCVAPGCPSAVKVGSGRLLPARDTNGYVELRLDAKYAGRYAGKSRLLQLAVAMARLPGGAAGSATFSSSTSTSAPFMLLSTRCN